MDHPESVLVTGATGFIGSTVARRLAVAGVRTTGLLLSGRQQHRLANVAGLRMVSCDDYSESALETALAQVQPEAIIHLAAAGVCGAVSTPQMLSVNVEFTANLMQAAARAGRPTIVHIGSCFEYQASDENNLTEMNAIQPFSVYGATKAASVHIAQALAQTSALRLIVLRLFGVYGQGEAEQRLVPTLIRNLKAQRPAPLTSGSQVRDWLHVDDAADAIIAATQIPLAQSASNVYNVCTGVGTSVRELGNRIADALGRPRALLQWGTLPDRLHEPRRIVGDPLRLHTVSPWRPRHSLASGLLQTIHATGNLVGGQKLAA